MTVNAMEDVLLYGTLYVLVGWFIVFNNISVVSCWRMCYNKGNNKITELRTILQRESQNS
jgi:hypothetical protein